MMQVYLMYIVYPLFQSFCFMQDFHMMSKANTHKILNM